MRVFAPERLLSRDEDEFISASGYFLVAVYTILSQDDFIPA